MPRKSKKYTWLGASRDLLSDDISDGILDGGDPNFDALEVALPPVPLLGDLTEAGVKAALDGAIQEFFVSHDVEDLAQVIFEYPAYPSLLIERLLRAATAHPAARAPTSAALSAGYPALWSRPAIAAAFQECLFKAGDATLDSPQATTILGTFIARAVADEIVDPAWVRHARELARQLGPYARAVVDRAEALLAPCEQGTVRRLEAIWGPTQHSVAALKAGLANLIAELQVSGDIAEAVRCIRELGVERVRFHLVKVALVACVDAPKTEHVIVGLFKEVLEEGIIGEQSILMGIKLVAQAAGELTLDVSPKAPEHLKHVLRAMASGGLLRDEQCEQFAQQIDATAQRHKEQIQELRKQLEVSKDNRRKLGAAGEPRPCDDMVRQLALQLKEAVEAELGVHLRETFEPMQFCAQMVAGVLFFISVRINETEAVHLRAFQALPHKGSTIHLAGLKRVPLEEPLAPFF